VTCVPLARGGLRPTGDNCRVSAAASELLRYRYLFEQMVRRELRQKYKGSALGLLWYVVNPLVLMAAYTVMFTYVLKNRFGIHDYALFVLIGILVWTFFQQSLLSAASSLLDQGALLRKAVFPRETIPGATVTVQLVTFAMILGLICPVVFIVHGSLSAWVLLLPLYVAALYVFTLGLGLIVAVLHAYFRDVAPILGAALLPWFFITPIFYRASNFPGASHHAALKSVLRWGNPVAPFVDTIRSVIFDGRSPGGAETLYVLVAATLALSVGVALFRRMQGELAVVV
jgi:lipopolysaccharide transport system permease protein